MSDADVEREATPPSDTASPSPNPRSYKLMLTVWAVIAGLALLGLHFNVDKSIIAAGVFLLGLASNALAWLVAAIGLIPVIGPLIVKVLSVGFIWLINAVGYLVSLIAIRRGYSKDVLTYRGLTIALIVGMVIGYILAKIV